MQLAILRCYLYWEDLISQILSYDILMSSPKTETAVYVCCLMELIYHDPFSSRFATQGRLSRMRCSYADIGLSHFVGECCRKASTQ